MFIPKISLSVDSDISRQQIQANWLGKIKKVFAISRERVEKYKIS